MLISVLRQSILMVDYINGLLRMVGESMRKWQVTANEYKISLREDGRILRFW